MTTTKDPKTRDEAELREEQEAASRTRSLGSSHAKAEVNQPDAEENVTKSRDAVQELIEKRSQENLPGHEKNMKAIEETPEPKTDPRLGREDNGNTPVIDEHGNKTWIPPGVAFAPKR